MAMSKHDMAVDLARSLEAVKQAREKIAEAMRLINIASVLTKDVGDQLYPLVLEEMNSKKEK
jgi:hypothetical protein